MTNEEAISRIQRALSVPDRLHGLVLIDEESANKAIEALKGRREVYCWECKYKDICPQSATLGGEVRILNFCPYGESYKGR